LHTRLTFAIMGTKLAPNSTGKSTLHFLTKGSQMKIIAWHNEPKLKHAAMERLIEHRKLDQIAQGFYFDEGRGCHLGCLTHCDEHKDPHSATELMFGIPERVAYWLEAVFEGLPQDKCANWVIESSESIPVGADLSKCHHELAYWLLGPDSPSAEGNRHESVRDAIEKVREIHRQAMTGEVDEAAWSAARSAAWSAARSAAESAARSAAESAAESAARSAAESAAWSAAESAAWEQIAEKSIEIFKNAPVIGCDACEELAEQSILRS
jgi:hypothetical protein